MHYQPIKTKQKSQLGINIAIALMVLFIVSVVSITLYYFLKPNPIYDKQTLCPVMDGVISPKNNVAILIDETGPSTASGNFNFNLQHIRGVANTKKSFFLPLQGQRWKQRE